jgi:hypothetical protein
MARPTLSRSDYIQAGKEANLEFVGKNVPDSVHTPTDWVCLNCGAEHVKSYRAVKYGKNGCTCQNSVTKKPKDYHDLAKKLGIVWQGETYSNKAPKNTKTPTYWVGKPGIPVMATYSQLAYGRLPANLKEQLGIK